MLRVDDHPVQTEANGYFGDAGRLQSHSQTIGRAARSQRAAKFLQSCRFHIDGTE